MALILKTGKTFNPSLSAQLGIDLTSGDFYGVIDRIEYDKSESEVSWSISIFTNKNARDMKGAIIADRMMFQVKDDKFLEVVGKDGLLISKAYELSLAEPALSDWKRDE